MEYIYQNLPDWFARSSFQALDDRVVFRYKTLVSDVQVETFYKDLSNKIVRGKQGNSNWSSVATTLLLLTVVGYLVAEMICPNWLNFQVFTKITLSATLLAGILFCIRFIKEEFVWFYDKANSIEFSIKITSKKREQAEQFIKFVQDKIQEANSPS